MMMRSVLGSALLMLLPTASPADPAPDPARGAYLVNLMHCNGCHTPRGPDGALETERFLQGGTVGFEIPGLGIFWPPNLTGDRETGLGGWSDAAIVAAIREGVRPDGRLLAPAMPANDYAMLSDEDAVHVVAYLRSLAPAVNAVPAPMADGGPATAPYYAVTLPTR